MRLDFYALRYADLRFYLLHPVCRNVPTAFAETFPLSSDSPVGNARALIERGQFTEALAVLRPLAPNHPDRTDVLFLVGLAALGVAQRPETPASNRIGLLDQAIAAFHAILIDRPELARVRLELARAFFLKGEDALSRKHFDRVLAGEPPSAIVANVQRFIEAMRAHRRWSGYFGAMRTRVRAPAWVLCYGAAASISIR